MASHSLVANAMMLIIIAAGIVAVYHTKKEVFPEFTNDTVEITASYPGATPSDIEQSIVVPIENAIANLSTVKTIDAQIEAGQAALIITLYDGADSVQEAQYIEDAINRIKTWPQDAEDPIIETHSSKRNVMRIVLFGPEGSENALKHYVDLLQTSLRADTHIGPVLLSGLRPSILFVDVPSHALYKYRFTLPDIASAIKAQALDTSSGSIKTNKGDILLSVNARSDQAESLAKIPIQYGTHGGSLYLGDIAQVYEGLDDRAVKYAKFNGRIALALDVFRTGDLTPNGVARAVDDVLKKFARTLPSNIQATVLNDRTKVYDQRARLLQKNGLIGLVLVLALLGIFMDTRYALWVSVSIPIAFLGAFVIFPIADISVNLVTMFAFIMCLGIVVDDAIIVAENAFSYLKQGYNPLDAAISGVKEVLWPVTFSVLTNIVAFLPLFFVSGIMGKIFLYIPAVVVMVFIFSLLECLFILPSHLASVHYRPPKTLQPSSIKGLIQQRFLPFLCDKYASLLDWTIANRYVVVACATACLLVTFAAVLSGRMGLELFPDVEDDVAVATIEMPVGTPLKDLTDIETRLLDAASEVKMSYPKEDTFRGVYSTIEGSRVQARLYLHDASSRHASTGAIVDSWRKYFDSVTGAKTEQFIINERGPGAGADLTIELSHEDNAVLQQAAMALVKQLKQYDILYNIDNGIHHGAEEWRFKLNKYGHALGLTNQYVAQQLKAALYGIEALTQHRDRDELDVLVRLPLSERDAQHDIETFAFYTPDSTYVHLRNIVDIQPRKSDAVIDRKYNKRIIAVTTNARPKSMVPRVQADLEEGMLKQLVEQYKGLTYNYGGKQTDIAESMHSLGWGFLCALFMMLALLVFLFDNIIQPIFILLVIPFSFIGVVIGHVVLGYALSVLSLFGMVALTGIIINDGVVLLKFVNNHAQNMSFDQALVMAAKRRFFPVLLTSITTFVGLMPIVLERSVQAKFLIPMAISLAFGAIFAMFITLIVLPALCTIVVDLSARHVE